MGHDLMDSPIVVTGASGPLAQEVIPPLSARHFVIGVTRQRSTEGLHSSSAVRYYGWDFFERPDLQSVHAVVHLAACVDFSQTLKTIVECVRTNVLKTAEVVHFCKRRKVARLIYASTVSVYRDDGTAWKTEESPIGPSSAYAASKLMGEFAVQAAGEGIEAVVLRFAGIYGQGDRWQPVLNGFIQQALRGGPIHVVGPENRRDYIYVKDAAHAVVSAVGQSATGVFNVASGYGQKVGEMAGLVSQVLGGRVEISPAGWFSPSEVVFDVSKARTMLDFRCQYTLHAALEDIRTRILVT